MRVTSPSWRSHGEHTLKYDGICLNEEEKQAVCERNINGAEEDNWLCYEHGKWSHEDLYPRHFEIGCRQILWSEYRSIT